MDLYTPTQIALPVAGPKISQDVVNLLNRHNINFHPLHKLKRVLNEKELEFRNGDRMDYDVLIGIPPHKIPVMVANSPWSIKGRRKLDQCGQVYS